MVKILTLSTIVWMLPGCASLQDRRVTDRNDPAVDSVTQVKGGYDTVGRKWGNVEVTQQVVPPAPRPAPASPAENRPVSAADSRACGSITTGLANMTMSMPSEVSVGQEFMYQLNATAVDCAAHVVVVQ